MKPSLVAEILDDVLNCVEMLYIVEYSSYKLVYLNQSLFGNDSDYMGKACYKLFFGREMPCEFCPSEAVCLEVQRHGEPCYSWEHFDEKQSIWLKIKNRICEFGGVKYRVGNIVTIDDMMKLSSTAVREMGHLMSLIEENTRIKRQLEQELRRDHMTGLFNRNMYTEDMQNMIIEEEGFGAVYFDINNLKETNDSLGHSDGDRLICQTAGCMRKVAGENGKCYRIGGDEFVLLMQGCTPHEVEHCADSFMAELLQYNAVAVTPCLVAVGFAHATSGSLQSLVAKAEISMYLDKRQDKKTGKGGM